MQVIEPLRVCRVCGRQAVTEEELELFCKDKSKPYGRATICKKCWNKSRRLRFRGIKSKKDYLRYMELIRDLEKPILCYVCGKEITKLRGRDANSLVFHSLDGDHENWEPSNKVPAHNGCHIRHHNNNRSLKTVKRMSEAKLGSKNPQWKGEEASNQAKYLRGWNKRRREKEKTRQGKKRR